jgi:hypothetical protein
VALNVTFLRKASDIRGIGEGALKNKGVLGVVLEGFVDGQKDHHWS